jgi:hypothetical protein
MVDIVGEHRLQMATGSVALSVGKIEAVLSCEVVGSSSLVAAAEVGVRRLPLPAPK